MKHKKYLFTTFFLLLFIFQQTQAFAKISPDINDLYSNQSLQASGLPDKILVYMYQFTPGGAPTEFPCEDGDTTLGCVESFSGLTYPPDTPYVTFPYGGVNPILVDVENYYLKNVLPREMNVAENYPTLAALQAQALAARSIADWKPRAFGAINFDNTTNMQVFVPGSYEKYLNPENPVEIQNRISEAITSTSRQYLSYSSNGESIDAEFGSDWLAQTYDEPSKGYLEVVQDPISTICDAIDNNGGYGGMSQKGAIRWSLGNQCAAGGSDSTKWPVTWTDYRQILVHYYTGIDILNGSGVKVAPDDRWNLLQHNNFGSPVGTSHTLVSGQPASLQIRLQNTSTTAWNVNGTSEIEIDYHWGDNNWQTASVSPSFTEIAAGKEFPDITAPLLTVSNIIPPAVAGTESRILHIDIKRNGVRLSSTGWPDAQIAVTVNGIATPTPTATPPSSSDYALCFNPTTTRQMVLMPAISTISESNINLGGNMTVEFWARTGDSYSGGSNWYESRWVIDKDVPGSGTPDWAIALKSGKVVASGSGSPFATSGISIADGQWHHVAYTRNISTREVAIYIDGFQSFANTPTTLNNAGNTSVMGFGAEGGGPLAHAYRGVLDEVRLWNVVRTPGEIQAAMRTYLTGAEPGLVGYWDFNEGSGQVAHDKTANHADGQLGNPGPSWIRSADSCGAESPLTPQPTLSFSTPTPLPPGYTPPAPTATFTPLPTATQPPPYCCPARKALGLCPQQSSANRIHFVSFQSLPSIQEGEAIINLLYRVNDEVLSQTPEGQRYIDLYYGNGVEISAILGASPELADEAIATLQLWQPNLQALVDGNGNAATISAEQVQAIQTFLDHLYALGSPELQQTITSERARMPLEQTIGMKMDQAWASLNGFQVQPTSWEFEYPTTTQTTFQVSETDGLESLDNVSFTTSDLVQVGQPANVIPANAFTFTPNGFSVPMNSSQNVLASVDIPSGTPIGTYIGNITVSSASQTITIAVEVTVTQVSCTPSNSYTSSSIGGAKFASLTASNVTNFQHLPLSFVPNMGQEDESVRFQAQGLGGSLFFTPGEVVFSLPNPVKVKEDDKEKIRYDLHPVNVVRIHYQGANVYPEVAGIGALPGVANYLQGNDPSKWLTDLPTYSGIAYRELYAGIELRYEGTDGKLKSTFHVAPGADPSAIIWKYKGAEDVNVDESGNLVISLPEPAGNGAALIERAPIAWQEVNGNRVMVAAQYALDKNDKKVSFLLPDGYDSTLPLVIDPELTYSAYLGGGAGDQGQAITLDADCNIYLTGVTYSTNFPTVTPIQTNQPGGDVFVSKLNAAGDALLYSTYIGGDGSDHARGIALDSQGRIAIVGETESTNFPTMNAYDSSYGGGTCPDGPCDDVFVAQLLADGSALRYSAYLGGNKDDEGHGMVLGPDDMIYLTGWARSSTFPTVNAYDNTFGGGTCDGYPCEDAFVTKIDPAGTGANSLLYSTFLGGNNYDQGLSIAVDTSGRVYVTGFTRSNNYPTLNPHQSALAGYSDIFVTKLDTTLSGTPSLLYSTYLGGSATDQATGIALNGANQVYLTGHTRSANFPLTNAFDNSFGGGTCGSSVCYDAFITHLDIANNIRVYSSYLGGSGEDDAAQVTAVDEFGNAYITGYTKSTNFPVINAIQPTKGVDSCASAPCADAFVTKINAAGNAIIHSTYLGGSADDYGNAIILDGLGGTYIVGYTFSSNFPITPGSFPYVGAGSYSDAFVVKIDD